MKKFLFIAVLSILLSDIVHGQSFTLSKTTLTNADTATAVLQIKPAVHAASVQLDVTKTSGTVAGTAILQGSIDGAYYQTIGSDTFTFANVAAQHHIWDLGGIISYRYYRLYILSSGTQVSTIAAVSFGRTN